MHIDDEVNDDHVADNEVKIQDEYKLPKFPADLKLS